MRTSRNRLSSGLALLLLAGCGTARRSEPLIGPLELDPVEQRGRLVFMQHCHACHPGGEAGLGPALNNKPLPAALITLQTRAGLGAMPSFNEEHIVPEDVSALTAYLIQLRRAE